MKTIEQAAAEFVAKFNETDIDSVGEYGTDVFSMKAECGCGFSALLDYISTLSRVAKKLEGLK